MRCPVAISLAYGASWIWFWCLCRAPGGSDSALLERKFQAPSLCFRDPEPGPCGFIRRVWYFDHRSRVCSRFPYGGCRGNANRFESRRACLRICTGAGGAAGALSGEDPTEDEEEEISKNTASAAVPPVIVIDSWDAICLQEPDTGSCPSDPSVQGRYWHFYNASSGVCEEFLYYGCGVNNNNRFATGIDCRMACGHLGARWKVRTCDVCDSSTSLCSRETDWTFWCRCRGGFHREPSGRCADDDECDAGAVKTAKCDSNAWCINTPGSYLCTCMAGYMGDGQKCTKGAVIELPPATRPGNPPTAIPYNASSTWATPLAIYTTTPTVVKLITYDPWPPSHFSPAIPEHLDCLKCHKNATCWYGICQCKRGFAGDGVHCQDINECLTRTSECSPEATCFNTDGSYYCKCPSGYAGTGFFCTRDKSVCSDQLDAQYREQCGEAYFQRRYYYDQRYRQCRMFWYDNCRGTTRNVFPDLGTCRTYCEASANGQNRTSGGASPSGGAAAKLVTSAPSSVVGGVDRSSWHTAAVAPRQCRDPYQPGSCYGAYFMYYYNWTSHACVPFIYTGCGGNENRFLTKSSCEETCSISHHSPETDCLQPVDYGYGRYDKKCQPHVGYAWFYDQDGDECGRFWYQGCGGNVNRYSTEHECKTKCLGRSQKLRHHPKMMPFRHVRDCFHDKKDGHCYNIPNKPRSRYFYDHTDRQCKQFMYNGCGGNTNRFGSREFCESTCQQTFKPKSKLCMHWADIGPCNDMQTVWYYDLKTGTCQTFQWSGCGGNLNRFRNRHDCESICIPTRQDPCNLPKLVGPCAHAQQRFYYDPIFAICRPFIYGGCKGNDNNFHSIGECRLKCERFETALPSLRGGSAVPTNLKSLATKKGSRRKKFYGGGAKRRMKTRRRIMMDSESTDLD